MTHSLYSGEYDEAFAASYDAVIDWEARSRNEGAFFVDLLASRGVRRVLDVACGTGFHLAAFAAAGFEAVGSDGSPEMVARARRKMEELGYAVPVHVADWMVLAGLDEGPFDAVVCLGSSISHAPADQRRVAVFEQFAGVLRPGGILVLDHRHYERLGEARAPSAEASGGSYCCCSEAATISLTRIDGVVVRNRYQVAGRTHEFLTYETTVEDTRRMLQAAGFTRSDTLVIHGGRGDPAAAEFIIHVAERTGAR